MMHSHMNVKFTNGILQTTGISNTKDYGGTPASSTECFGVILRFFRAFPQL